MNFVPCIAWVPRGKAASSPEKLHLSPEELKRLVNETKEQCKQNSLEEDEDDFSDENSEKEDEIIPEALENDDDVNESNDEEDFDARYNLDDYDNDEQNPLFTINDLAVHVDNHDDEYITDEESIGDLEDKEDDKIKPSDNLLITGHVEDSSSVLEIHVYNQEDDDFYVHHDIVLPSYPLCLAWLDFHPGEEQRGNYVAVGDMSPVIKIYDLDVVDVLEPEFSLGKMTKKQKAKKKDLNYHTDAVLSLSWNKNVRKLLASGSADSSVVIWDLSDGTVLNKLIYHKNKVQALEWHPTESQFLLSGCTDGILKLYDCQSEGDCREWKVNGEIEKVIWHAGDSFSFFCSTDQGCIYAFDIRRDKELKVWQSHKEAVTGLDMSPLKPNVLLSASMDRTLKVWDLDADYKMIKSLKLKVGSIYAAKVAPDLDFTVAVGGNNASNSLKVIDIFRENENAQKNTEGEISGEVTVKKEAAEHASNFKSEDIKKETIDGTNVKIEVNSPVQKNKRIIYDAQKNSDGEISKEVTVKKEAAEPTSNFKSEDMKKITLDCTNVKTEVNSPVQKNKRIIYDLEEDRSEVKSQTSVAEKHKKQKKSKRKQ